MDIKRVLISQPEPKGTSPYTDLISKHGVAVDFRPFFSVEAVSLRDFIAQRVNILDYSAIIFTSRTAIDAFFSICEQSRLTVPETMKYFCQNQQIALYLQKYIVYRKRKIFFGDGRPMSVVDIIGAKHKNENFLVACTDSLRPELAKALTAANLKFGSAVFMTSVIGDIKHLTLADYSVMVFYSPCDIKSLLENYPDFKQEGTIIATYGDKTAQAAKDAGLNVEIMAPTPQAPSIAQALSLYCSQL